MREGVGERGEYITSILWSSSDQMSHFSYPGYHEHRGNYSKELLYYR